MTYKTEITVGELRKTLKELPQDAYIDIAQDEEINMCGPIAMHENGTLDVQIDIYAEDGNPTYILYPSVLEMSDERYEGADI